LEQHEGEQILTEFSFLGELTLELPGELLLGVSSWVTGKRVCNWLSAV